MSQFARCTLAVLAGTALLLPSAAWAAGPETLDLLPEQFCVTDPSGQVAIDVQLSAINPAHPILAANVNLAWDPNSCWQAIDIVPGDGFDQHGTENTGPGYINYSVTRKVGQPGITATQVIAKVIFQATLPPDGCCVETIGLSLGSGVMATKVVGLGYQSIPILGASKQIRFDTVKPEIVCGENMVKGTDPGVCTWTPTPQDPVLRPTVTDNCTDCPVTITFVRSDGQADLNAPYSGVDNKGLTTITWTATDCCGNAASCVQTITVQDNEAPVITPSEGEIRATVDDTCKYVLEDVRLLVTITDNCTPDPNVQQTPAAGTVFGPGTYDVVVNANDSHGNNAEALFTLIVEDKTAPVWTDKPADIEVYADAGKCTAKVSWAIGAQDNCNGPVTIACDPPSGFDFPVGGPHLVTCTATDGAGNVATHTFNVTVKPQWILRVSVKLKGRVAAGPFDRCVQVQMYDCDGVLAPQAPYGVFTFTGGVATADLYLDVPAVCDPAEIPYEYTCARAKDLRFSLWSTVEGSSKVFIDGTVYKALFLGDDALVLGDMDNSGGCDIVDWLIWMLQFTNPASIPPPPSAPCIPFPNPAAVQYADLTGDGLVTAFDFSHLYLNNGKADDPICCVVSEATPDATPIAPVIVNRIAVPQLGALGLSAAAKFDLNKDGYIDKADMALYSKAK
jgi:hypothetical protein